MNKDQKEFLDLQLKEVSFKEEFKKYMNYQLKIWIKIFYILIFIAQIFLIYKLFYESFTLRRIEYLIWYVILLIQIQITNIYSKLREIKKNG